MQQKMTTHKVKCPQIEKINSIFKSVYKTWSGLYYDKTDKVIVEAIEKFNQRLKDIKDGIDTYNGSSCFTDFINRKLRQAKKVEQDFNKFIKEKFTI
jgi:hypothetical protein